MSAAADERAGMTLRILLPDRVQMEDRVSRVRAEAPNGHFCLLPRHVDFATVLMPSILSWVAADGQEGFAAVEDALAAEKEGFLRELRRRAAAEVYAACRKAMKDLADPDLEQRVVDVFLEKLADSDAKVRDTLRQAAADGDGRMAMRSSFELSGKGRQRVTERLQRMVSEDVAVDYETDPDLLLGIEVEGQGRRVAWHVRDYFDTLHDRAAELFAEAGEMDGSEAKTDARRQ